MSFNQELIWRQNFNLTQVMLINNSTVLLNQARPSTLPLTSNSLIFFFSLFMCSYLNMLPTWSTKHHQENSLVSNMFILPPSDRMAYIKSGLVCHLI